MLGAGVVLQAASHSPARKADINIRNLILFGDIFKKKIGSGCHQSEVITVSNIRFCQSCVKPVAGALAIQYRPAFGKFCLQNIFAGAERKARD